jgi:hypothetical protein
MASSVRLEDGRQVQQLLHGVVTPEELQNRLDWYKGKVLQQDQKISEFALRHQKDEKFMKELGEQDERKSRLVKLLQQPRNSETLKWYEEQHERDSRLVTQLQQQRDNARAGVERSGETVRTQANEINLKTAENIKLKQEAEKAEQQRVSVNEQQRRLSQRREDGSHDIKKLMQQLDIANLEVKKLQEQLDNSALNELYRASNKYIEEQTKENNQLQADVTRLTEEADRAKIKYEMCAKQQTGSGALTEEWMNTQLKAQNAELASSASAHRMLFEEMGKRIEIVQKHFDQRKTLMEDQTKCESCTPPIRETA